jgi:GDPmannose 4,6-dehydratase
MGTLNILEAMRILVPKAKFYFAASSEMFGSSPSPQNELTPFHPRSPYGVSKLAGFHLVKNYREAYGLFCCSGILFNHESPRRGKEFVTRKITSTLGKIIRGEERQIILGNLDTKRDWGFAGDYVEAMWLMLQQKVPDDYVIATGETHTIKEFLNEAFNLAGLNWEDYIVQDERFMRPADVNLLYGDYSKAFNVLGWKPRIKFKELVKMMVEADR